MPLKLILYPDYLKHSSVNATDRQDVKEALQSVSKAAKHFEEMIKRDVSLIPDLMAREIKTRIAVISGGSRIFPGGGGAPTPKVGVLTYFFGQKLHENERIRTPGGGGRVPGAPLRSATGNLRVDL